MAITITCGKSCRIGSESTLSGSETITSDVGVLISHSVAASTTEAVEGVTIDRADLEALYFSSDGACRLRLYDDPITVASWPSTTTATMTGDYTGIFFAGDSFCVSGSTSNDGFYTVYECAYSDPTTTLTVYESAPWTAEAVASSKIQKYVGMEPSNYAITAVSTGAGGTFTVAEDLSELSAGDKIMVRGSSNNDTLFTVASAVYTTSTVITVSDDDTVGATADGEITKVRTDLILDLVANVPFLWTVGGGVDNPLVSNVTAAEITNESTTTAVALSGRYTTA